MFDNWSGSAFFFSSVFTAWLQKNDIFREVIAALCLQWAGLEAPSDGAAGGEREGRPGSAGGWGRETPGREGEAGQDGRVPQLEGEAPRVGRQARGSGRPEGPEAEQSCEKTSIIARHRPLEDKRRMTRLSPKFHMFYSHSRLCLKKHTVFPVCGWFVMFVFRQCQANIRSYFLCMTESDQRIKILKKQDGTPRNFTVRWVCSCVCHRNTSLYRCITQNDCCHEIKNVNWTILSSIVRILFF